MTDLRRIWPVIASVLLWGCAEPASEPAAPEPAAAHHTPSPSPKVFGPVSQLAPLGVPISTRRVRVTASGEAEESPEPAASESQSRGNVGLEPEIWDPNAFIRPRRRMTVDQLDQAIRDATGGIGWDDSDNNYASRFLQLGPTLGVPDYFRRTKLDLSPGMTFQKFLSDGANVVCATLMNHEQNIPAEERVFFVHIGPETNPVNAPEATDSNIQMLLLRFHGKAYALDGVGIQPWRNLVNTISGNVGPVWGEWLEAWTAICIAMLKHPDFYSY